MSVESFVYREANRLGFAAVGIAAIGPCRTLDRFQNWLSRGYAADMDYLARNTSLRADPTLLAPGAKSVIVVAARYPVARRMQPFSAYACGCDYHAVLRSKLQQLAKALEAHAHKPLPCRICVDSAPVLEREWAVAAGLGWIGRQGSLVHAEYGCTLFLGEMLVDLELEPSGPLTKLTPNKSKCLNFAGLSNGRAGQPVTPFAAVGQGCPTLPKTDTDEQLNSLSRCGSCRKCVDACPTGAIQADGSVDARRCISYMTIEHAGDIPESIRPLMGESLFGCDRCTSVCPFNRLDDDCSMPEFQPGACLPTAEQCLAMGAADFRRRFRGTSVYRSGLARLRRNAGIVLSNRKNGARP